MIRARCSVSTRRGGFTLLELLIGSLGMLLLGAVIFVVYLVTLQGLSVLNAHYVVVSQLQSAAEQMERDIHYAKGRVGTPCGSYPLNNIVLILDAPDIGGAGINKVIYRTVSGSLRRILQNDDCSIVSPTFRNLTPAPATLIIPVDFGDSDAEGVVARIFLQSRVAKYKVFRSLALRYNYRNQ